MKKPSRAVAIRQIWLVDIFKRAAFKAEGRPETLPLPVVNVPVPLLSRSQPHSQRPGPGHSEPAHFLGGSSAPLSEAPMNAPLLLE
jgi:hypothetical protein